MKAHAISDAGSAPLRRLAEYALVIVMFAGSLAMWIGIPLGCIWLISHLADHYPVVYGAALLGCPLAMVLFGLVLARVNRLYLRLTGAHPAQARSAWLRSFTGDRRTRRPRAVLDTSMVVSVVLALIALAIWFFFFAHSYLPE